MGLTRANIVDFAQTIAGTTGSTLTMNVAYDEVMQHLARSPKPPFMQASNFNISSGTSIYTWSADVVRILGVFVESKQLYHVNTRQLENYDDAWRESSADAVQAYHADENTLRKVRLFPSPSTAATGTWLHSYAPTSDVPSHFCLYVAFAVLERVFSYPDARQDKEFAALCGQLALIFARLIGY